jgi:hypothetical protein
MYLTVFLLSALAFVLGFRIGYDHGRADQFKHDCALIIAQAGKEMERFHLRQFGRRLKWNSN